MTMAFQPDGPIASFTGATTAPTAVQTLSLSNTPAGQVMITNISSTIDCVVGWDQTSDRAKLNAVEGAGTPNTVYVLRGTQVAVTAGPEMYFTGITPSSTAVIKVQRGSGN